MRYEQGNTVILSGIQKCNFEEIEKNMDEIKLYKEMLLVSDRNKGAMYDDRADKYEHVFKACVGFADPDVTALGASDLKLDKDTKIIDFACGTGLVAD